MIKVIKRILIFTLCVFAVLSCASCQKSGQSNDQLFEQLLSATEPENIIEPFADKVYVVIPQSASSLFVSKALDFANEITKKTGVDTFLKY